MSKSALAITEEHTDLADSAIGQLEPAEQPRGGPRDAGERVRPSVRDLVGGQGPRMERVWRIAEEHGGSGFGLAELAVVLEAQGRELSPGPFLPTVAAAVVIDRCAPDSVRAQLLPGLADGSTVGALGPVGQRRRSVRTWSSPARAPPCWVRRTPMCW